MESVIKTKEFLENGESVIYEATFTYNEVLAALDILVKDKDGWKAYEVKSSTSVSETYVKDAAIQYYTIINSGIGLLVHLTFLFQSPRCRLVYLHNFHIHLLAAL